MNGYLQSALIGALFLTICGAIGTSLLFYAQSDMAAPYHGAITPKAVAPSETEITREAPAPLHHDIQGVILVTAVILGVLTPYAARAVPGLWMAADKDADLQCGAGCATGAAIAGSFFSSAATASQKK